MVLAPLAIRLVSALLAFSVVLGCETIDRFGTEGAAAYCGGIVESKFVWTPPAQGGFDRELRLALTLDTSALTTVPGRITTDDADHAPCGDDHPGVPTFHDAKLVVTPEVANDPLSALTFEDGQVHNIMAWVDSSCQERILAVVSLYKANHVELRLMKPGISASDSKGAFALFPLERRDDGCGWAE